MEVDTSLATQSTRLEMILRDPAGKVVAFDANSAAHSWPIAAGADEPYQWAAILPTFGVDGVWTITASVYDEVSHRFQAMQTLPFNVPTATLAVPTLTGISPVSVTGGTAAAVTISGSNFVAGATSCTAGGVALTNINVVGSNTLTGNLSATLLPGTHDISCTTIAGTGALGAALTVTAPHIQASPNSRNFGAVNAETTQTFTLTNAGNQDLLITSLQLTGAGSAAFSISGDTCANITLGAAVGCTFDIVASATQLGVSSAVVEVAANSPYTPVLTIPLSARVVVDTDGDGVSDDIDNCPAVAKCLANRYG